MSYSLYLNFVLVEWFLAESWPLNLYFLFKCLVVQSLFLLPMRYWLDIWYVAISRWVTVYIWTSFWSNDFWLSYGPWTCIFCSNFNLSGLFDVLWDIDLMVCGYIQVYSLNSNFVLVEWSLAELWPLNLYFKLSGHLFDVLWYIDLIFGMWLYLDELQFKLEFRSGRMIFGWVMALELVFYVKILSFPNFFLSLRYWLDIWYVAISRWVTVEVRISFRWNDFWLGYGPWTCIFCLFKL